MNPAHRGLCLPGLDEGESFIFRWQFNLMDPADFAEAFTRALIIADSENTDRLARGFPVEVQALREYRHVDGYWGALCDKAYAAGLMENRSP